MKIKPTVHVIVILFQCIQVKKSRIKAFSTSTTRTRAKLQQEEQQKQQTKPKITANQERKWMEKYHELCIYSKENNGNTQVPLNYPHSNLGTWVQNQRRSYQLYLQNKPTFLTPQRIRALDSLNFIWNVHEYTWNIMFQKLLEFQLLYHHTFVPKSYNPKLCAWVLGQRAAFKKSELSAERVKALESVHFCWYSNEPSWEYMFESLVNYKSSHGTFDIPSSDTVHLYLKTWIHKIRTQYYHYHLDNKNLNSCTIDNLNLTTERIAALNEIQFSWNGPRVRSRLEQPQQQDWETLFQRMKEKGIDSSVKPKTHWFEGLDRFDRSFDLDYNNNNENTENNGFDIDDLDSLWYQEED